jgi:4-hydroxybenzoate polyprenyltransferase
MDDVKVGVKSTALLFAGNTKRILLCFATGSFLAICASSVVANLHWCSLVGLGAAYAVQAVQILRVDLDDVASCRRGFEGSIAFGGIVFVSLLGGTLLKESPDEKNSEEGHQN